LSTRDVDKQGSIALLGQGVLHNGLVGQGQYQNRSHDQIVGLVLLLGRFPKFLDRPDRILPITGDSEKIAQCEHFSSFFPERYLDGPACTEFCCELGFSRRFCLVNCSSALKKG